MIRDHNILAQLIHSIRQPILFYAPQAVFNSLSTIDVEKLTDFGLVDHLVMIKVDSTPTLVTDATDCLDILQKETLLKNNLFQLLSAKSELEASAFNYLVSAYISELDAWISATHYIKENAHNDSKNYALDIQSYLNMQHNQLTRHKQELSANLQNSFPTENKQGKSNEESVLAIIKDTEVFSNSANPKRKTTRKKVVLTNKEADDYLLEHIFNVDPSAINP